ncbi:hypothetical protein GCM10020367_64060 [Streptomyces sannanensis]|uniref:Zinc finger DksA/TraR C4-type domain-containing protein n=1 Tax=Streptomyces sannanensis TaxID=285536 RepID=A0ABP6SL74_9ACTN
MKNQVVAANNAGLAPEDLATLRESLHEQRLFRLEQLRTDVHVRPTASARMVLTDVEAALDRMDQDRYGNCHLCTRPITLRRLKIVPQARYCTRCQQVRDAGR